jgi:UDP-2,4-diacetamido-2,4,6-trideoxy-beta-L-altropyranose hydrolase
MRAAFRLDASAALGSGHLARCLVLAEELRLRGCESLFLCRDLPGNGLDLISLAGYPAIDLPPDGDDLPACAHALKDPVDWLVVDHYQIDRRWESAMRPRARRILVLDDLANRPHDCDLLLDPNLLPHAETRYANLLPPACPQLLGPAYALLRPEFREATPPSRLHRPLRRLLVSFGGSDPDNLTARALREIAPLRLHADVVLGAANPHLDDVRRLCDDSNGRWTLHVQTRRMARLMADADLALGAGGGTHWERCRMGLPALVVAAADNQIPSSRELDARGACRYLGPTRDLPPLAFLHSLQSIAPNLHAMSHAARQLVPDANGPQRVANHMLNS